MASPGVSPGNAKKELGGIDLSTLLEMKGICKSFNGVPALRDVQLTLESGEVHALLGENGAGKSTLIKILGGIYSKDSGDIFINGKQVQISNVKEARENGISIIHQELMMLPQMRIYENVFLGQEYKNRGFVKRSEMIEKTREMLKFFSLDLDPKEKLGHLPIAQQQIIEIIRAISFGARIIVMDEPTSSLSDKEVDFLFSAIRRLKGEGVGIIYISHRMSELDEIADRVTVMRDGGYVATEVVKEVTREELITKMVGRTLGDYYVHTHTPSDEVVMKVTNYSDGDMVKDASFELHRGEVLGFAGLVGAGRSELMSCIFGVTKKTSGELTLEGKAVSINGVKDAMAAGIALVPEDRKQEALYLDQSVRYNMTIEVLDDFLKLGRYDGKKESAIVDEYVQKMSVKLASPSQKIIRLSGGNQQKVIIGRWLAGHPKILILDEPTRGVDVGAKVEIYQIIDELVKSGVSVIIISSELPEVIGMSDRIVVMGEGRIKGVLERNEADQERIMSLATAE